MPMDMATTPSVANFWVEGVAKQEQGSEGVQKGLRCADALGGNLPNYKALISAAAFMA